MVRLKDIAQAAGVSVMTVSKALRNKPDLAAATRSRIQSLAAQMGYVPDMSASGLRNGKNRLFGLIIPATTDPIHARVMMSLEQAVHDMGFDLVLAHSLGDVEREATVIRRLIARRVDGLFICPVYRMERQAPAYQELQRSGLPTIILGHSAPFCAEFPCVATDDTAAAAQVTRHLLDLGHRKIAFFAGPMVAPWAQERLEGYRSVLRDAGIPTDDHLLFNAGSTIAEGAEAALKFLQERPQATAIQAANDLIAIGCANILIENGVRIPQELSVAGFGNVLTSEFFRVPLTTVRQPKLRLGKAAMELMQQLLQRKPVESRRMPAEMILRASIAPAPAA